MIKSIPLAAAAALLASPALTAPAPAALPASAWVISPGDDGCRTDFELTGRSGASVPVQLVSDGALVGLRFAKSDLPERAFLALRIDQKRFSNLMLRTGEAGVGEIVISPETEAAMRKGKVLDIAWLADEPVGASLSGSEQGFADLRTCGLQASSQHRAQLAAKDEADARAKAERHAQALQQAQLEAAQAEAAAAEARRQAAAEEVEARRQAELEQRQLAAEEAQRQSAYEAAQRRRAWEDQQDAYAPPPQYPPPQAAWPQPAYPIRRW